MVELLLRVRDVLLRVRRHDCVQRVNVLPVNDIPQNHQPILVQRPEHPLQVPR